jgi:hypothetical protein
MTVWEMEIENPDHQERWQEFCEQFMSEDIYIRRYWRNNRIRVACIMRIDPFLSIDSTGSMPSFIDQATYAGFSVSKIIQTELKSNEHRRPSN